MRRALAALSLPIALAACGASPNWDAEKARSQDYRLEHPIAVVPQEWRGEMVAGPDHRVHPAPGTMRGIVVDYTRRGHGALVVSGGKAAVATTVSALVAAGARRPDIEARSEPGTADVEISFRVYRAVPPSCGAFRSDSYAFGALSPVNAPSSEHGCTAQANLAAMALDPMDLVHQRTGQGGRSDFSVGLQRDRDTFTIYEKPSSTGSTK